MNFGLTQEEFAILASLVIRPLKDLGAKVWIFGSRARGDHRPFSDIDVLFELPPEKNLRGSVVGHIKEQIEESRIPFKVDLVEYKELADSYKIQVQSERVTV